jgi:hypothetical protein
MEGFWVMDGICPVCGHCGDSAWVGPPRDDRLGRCTNCALRGRQAPLIRPRTSGDSVFGVPDPLFFVAANERDVIPGLP